MGKKGFIVQDNFLQQREQNLIKNIVTLYELPWFYHETTAYDEDEKNQRPQMCHYLYYENSVSSKYYHDIMSCFFLPEFNDPAFRLSKIKLNLNMPYKDRKLIRPHTDLNGEPGITYLYYPITSDGPTTVWHNRWQTQKIDPIQGRMVKLPGDMLHTGNNPYKYHRRMVLNIVFEVSAKMKKHLDPNYEPRPDEMTRSSFSSMGSKFSDHY